MAKKSSAQAVSTNSLDLRADVMWVYQMLGGEECGPPPSSGAKGLYNWVIDTPTNQSEFYRSIWPKFAPDQSYFAEMERYRDDGRRQLSVLAAFSDYLNDNPEMKERTIYDSMQDGA